MTPMQKPTPQDCAADCIQSLAGARLLVPDLPPMTGHCWWRVGSSRIDINDDGTITPRIPTKNFTPETARKIALALLAAAHALADAGLLAPDESERLPSWVYDHPDVWTNPRRQGGSPCIRGTRINVDILLSLMDGPGGMTDEQILEDYPTIPADRLAALRIAHRTYDQEES